jgi:large repetitive protein
MTITARPRSRRLAVAGAIVAAGLIASGLTQIAAAPDRAIGAGAPFQCDNNTIYGIIGATGGGNTVGDLMQISATDGTAVKVGSLTPGTNALGLTKDGGEAWAFQSGSSTAVKYDTTTGASTSITVGGSRSAIRGAVDPVNDIYYYASNGAPTTIYAYDTDSGTDIGEVGTMAGGKGGNGDMAFGTDGTLYLVDSDQVFAVKNVPSTAGTSALASTLIATLPSGTNSPGIAYSSDGYLYLVDNTTTATLYKVDPGTGTRTTMTISSGAGVYDLASCNFANSLRTKADVRSRVASTDQFTLTNVGFTAGNTATTDGPATGLQTKSVGPNLAVGNASYTITQTPSGTTDLSKYSVGWSCVNNTLHTTVASGTGNTATFTYPQATTADGSDVVCTFTDAALPKAVADSGSTAVNTTLTVGAPGVLSNDTGADIRTDGAGTAQATSHGSVTRQANGSYVYTPDHDFSGLDSFDYTITDVNGATASTTVDLTVTPTAADDTASTAPNTDVSLTTADLTTNDHGTTLALKSATQPTHGTVTVSGGTVTYSPDHDFVGSDSFTYTVEDPDHLTATARVDVTVNPAAVDDAAVTKANTPVDTAVLTSNDHGALTTQSITQPANGDAVLHADGTVTYTPHHDFSGDDTFTYTATDAGGTPYTANVDITVTPVAGDVDPTTTKNSPLTVDAAHGLLSGASGSGLHAAKTSDPSHGTVVVNPDGSYTYTPDTGYVGPDSFGYSVTDGAGRSSNGTVQVTVVTPADAKDDTATGTAGQPVTIDPLANDDATGGQTFDLATLHLIDPATNNSVDTLVVPDQGTWTVTNGKLVFTPLATFHGTATVGYRVTDSAGTTVTADASATYPVPVLLAQTGLDGGQVGGMVGAGAGALLLGLLLLLGGARLRARRTPRHRIA